MQISCCKVNIITTDICITARNYLYCNWLGIYDIRMCHMKVADLKNIGTFYVVCFCNQRGCQYRDCTASVIWWLMNRSSWWNENCQGKRQYSEETYPSAILSSILCRDKVGFQVRAIAQAVSRWLPTAAARVRARVWQMGFGEDKVALGQIFSEYFGFPCQSSVHRILYHHNHQGQVQ
jgi:hypothetical protein